MLKAAAAVALTERRHNVPGYIVHGNVINDFDIGENMVKCHKGWPLVRRAELR